MTTIFCMKCLIEYNVKWEDVRGSKNEITCCAVCGSPEIQEEKE